MIQEALWIRRLNYRSTLVDEMIIKGWNGNIVILSPLCWDAGRGWYPNGITISGYLVVTILGSYINSSHRLNKDGHFSSLKDVKIKVPEFLLCFLTWDQITWVFLKSKISSENQKLSLDSIFFNLLFFIYHVWQNSSIKKIGCDVIFYPNEMYHLSFEVCHLLCD